MQNITRLIVAVSVVAILALIHSCSKSTSGDCGVPGGQTTTATTGSTANLKWNAVSGAVSYEIQYKKTSSSTWQQMASGTDTVQLVALDGNENYEWQVKTLCTTGTSAFSASANFTTTTGGSGCGTPDGLSTTSIGSSTADLKWNAVSGVASYAIQYRRVGDVTWLNTTTFSEAIQLTGLNSNTDYEWQVKTLCSTSVSSFSPSGTFKTSACPDGYEGANCATAMNAKFIGSFNLSDTISSSSIASYTLTISAGSNANDIVIRGLRNYFGNDMAGKVNGNTFTITDGNLGPLAITNGKGTLTGNHIDFTYTGTVGSNVYNDHAVGTKQ